MAIITEDAQGPLIIAEDAKELMKLRNGREDWENVILKPYKRRIPYARDWVKLGANVIYSSERGLYAKDGVVYDERSAHHNGIIGPGLDLRVHINKENK